ncbi:TetR/AcrR family transcriptional regulator [Staphylococcus sp. FSL K6-0223]|uniref:TetR/AcrR family transcriptional regulator n=1 Tax=Staphylococcus sp. FSL K6-0223 TaxID=2921424 RepID=UPI0030F7C428
MKQGRPKEYNKYDVLEIAKNTFWEQGYYNVSTQQLCDATKLGKSSLYHSFKNKHHLFILTLEDYVNEGIKIQYEKVMNKNSVKMGIDSLLQWGLSIDFNDEDREGCYMINSYLEIGNHDSEVTALMEKNMKAIKKIISTAFDRASNQDELLETNYTLNELKEKFLIDYYGFRILNAIDRETLSTAEKRKNLIIKTIFK